MSLTAQHGKSTQVLYGIYDFSNFLSSVSVQQSIDEVETTTFGATAKTYIVGNREGKITGSGFYDQTATTGSDAVLSGDLGATSSKVLTVAPTGGATIGDRCYLANTKELNYSVDDAVADAVKVKAEWRADGGIDHGRIAHNLTAETTTGTSTVINNGAATTNGAAGNIHVTTVSGTTPTLDSVIQDSADGSTGWATIMTFTQATAATSERKTITGTVRQYIRESHTIGGTATPTFTYAVAFGRR